MEIKKIPAEIKGFEIILSASEAKKLFKELEETDFVKSDSPIMYDIWYALGGASK